MSEPQKETEVVVYPGAVLTETGWAPAILLPTGTLVAKVARFGKEQRAIEAAREQLLLKLNFDTWEGGEDESPDQTTG